MLKAREINALLRSNDVPFPSTMHDEDTACRKFIAYLHSALKEKLIGELKNADFMSLLLDETTDNTNNKVALIFVYYVTKGTTKEAMLALANLEGQGTGEAVFTAVNEVLQEYKVDINKIVCLGTDGASAMVAENGFCGLFKRRLQPHVLKFHCAAHRLQLAVQDALAIKVDGGGDGSGDGGGDGETASNDIMDFLEAFESTLKMVFKHFNKSAKRIQEFKELVDSMGEKYLAFKKLYNVRWLSRHEAIRAAKNNIAGLLAYTAKLFCLHPNDVTVQCLHRAVRDVRFLLGLHLFSKIHSSLAFSSMTLQKTSIPAAVLIDTIQQMSSKLKVTYLTRGARNMAIIYPPVKEFKEKTTGRIGDSNDPLMYEGHAVGFPESGALRQDECQGDIGFYNAFASKIVIPMIEGLTESLDKRFPSTALLKAFTIFEFQQLKQKLSTCRPEDVGDLYKAEIKIMGDYFKEERSIQRVKPDGSTESISIKPILGEDVDLVEEWDNLKFTLQGKTLGDLTSWKQVFGSGINEIYPNVFKLISISMILPLSTAAVERGFSIMNAVIKNKLRNRLLPGTVNELMNISINGPEMFVMDGGRLVLSTGAQMLLKSAKQKWVADRNK